MLESLTDAEYNERKLKKKKRRKKERSKRVFSSSLFFFFSIRENSLFVKYLNYVLLLVVIDTIVISQSLKRISSLSFCIRIFSFHLYAKHLRKIFQVFRTHIEDSVTFAYFCYTLLCCLSFCMNCECFTSQSQVYTKRTFFLFSV